MEVSLSEWQSFLEKHPNAHILQTGEWGKLKSAFGWQAVRLVNGDTGAQILFRQLPLGLTVAYIPKGPVGSEQSSVISDPFLGELDNACKQRHAIFLKIEPDEWINSVGNWPAALRPSPYNIQPPRTLVINLTGSEEDILMRMKQKTRYNIRLAEKKGVTVRAWNDLPAFHQMMLVTSGRDAFGVHSLAYYQKAHEFFHPAGMAELLVAEYEGRPLAALVVFARGKRAWYFYGASSDEERNLMPTYLLQWEAMRWARSKGCTEYDLWGVPDEDEQTLEENFTQKNDGLWGVYRFKRGFGGELKRAAQALDRVYNPLLYRLYLWRMTGREAG